MTAVILEPRPLYAIGTVARLTGLKPDTLRVWERRYGLGASHKSPSGRRQYTQADLEHLQLVAELVSTGTRIGEIASAGRKTLEIMLRRNGEPGARRDVCKPSVLFVGIQLCQWIDEHQGCLASVSAKLARVDLAAACDVPEGEIGPVEMLVIGCEALGFVQLQQIQALAERLGVARVLVSCAQPRERAVATLAQQGIATSSFPPAPGFLAFEVTRCAAEEAGDQPGDRLGALLKEKPREFSAEELARVLQLPGEGLRTVSELVGNLAEFEQRMADAPVDDWQQAASRACAYAYAGQARWLMEKALQVMLSTPGDAGEESGTGRLRSVRSPRRLHDAA
ncbi:MAG: MerR family transcriptional regulator [Halieaceae bacterium]|nr:MerR family transcriptional regulator [Halieaceae bacterium]MCP5146636.1 MerR family transcriptional regulator [Pseudomonadales bacterium]MCP5166539.1 MerR family transcriptional regulator [Pseudomonadales bacterium]MCP5186434.1 MerR family transcriptional regulator [Pseudomonadales bacterium]